MAEDDLDRSSRRLLLRRRDRRLRTADALSGLRAGALLVGLLAGCAEEPVGEPPTVGAVTHPADQGRPDRPDPTQQAAEQLHGSDWAARLDQLTRLAATDPGAYETGLQQVIDALFDRLRDREPDDQQADADALAYAKAIGMAWYWGLVPPAALAGADRVAAVERLAAPVMEDGPATAAGSLAYLTALVAIGVREDARALIALETCARRFPDEQLTALERASLLAQVYESTGRIDDALRLIARTVEAAEAAGRNDILANVYGTRAQIGYESGTFDRALRDLELAEAHAEATGSIADSFETFTLRLDLWLGLGRFDRVLRLTADLTSFGSEQAPTLAVYRATAFRCMSGREDDADALLTDLLDGDALSAELRAHARYLHVLVAIDRGQLDAARERLDELDAEFPLDRARFDQDRVDTADFNHVALGTRVLLDTGAVDLRAQAELHEAAMAALLRRWDALEVRSGGVGRLRLDRWRRIVGELARLRIALQDGRAGQDAALQLVLEVQARSSLARVLDAGVPEPDDIRTALGAQHGVLIFFPAARTTLVFAVDAETTTVVEVGAQAAFEQLSRELTRLLDEGREIDERFDAVAAQIREFALPGTILERVATWRAMTVVGADLVGDVPIEVLALPAATSAGRPETLGERLAIDHGASLGAWLALGARRGAAGPTAFWATLEPAAEFATEPARSFPARHVAALQAACGLRGFGSHVDREFSVAALLEAELAGVGCLHLLAHGVWDDAREVGAVLAVHPDDEHPDGILSADVVERLPIVPPLVLLSACRAGAAHPRSGDGQYNTLAGAFLRRGARAVVVSRGDLDLEEHAALMRGFHSAFDAGATPAEALRRARAAVPGSPRSPRRLRETRLQLIGWGW